MKTLKTIRIGAWGAVAAALVTIVVLGGFFASEPEPAEPVGSGIARVGGPFSLTSLTAEIYDNERLAGRPYLVFFGFTNCPDICPTTLYELTDLMAEMGSTADAFTPLFITVDPERDTREILTDYMTAFDPRIVALRGDKQEVDQVIAAFAAYYAKVPTENGYTMDHTASVILMDGLGKFVGTLDAHEPRETMLAKLNRLAGADG